MIMPLSPVIHTASALSTWTQTSDMDFLNGTFDNITIIGSGEAAELKIDLSEIQTWTEKTPASKPVGRTWHAMATVWKTDKMILFGGAGSSIWYNDETWIYDLKNNTWTDKTPSPRPVNYPSGRYGHAMAAIPGTDQVLLFGGRTITNLWWCNETWVYDLSNDNWMEKTPANPTPSNNPSCRHHHAMAAIPGTNKVLLFGGNWNLNDTWVYDGLSETWNYIIPTGSQPSGRYGHAMAAIPGTDQVVLFGGQDSSGYKDDTWVYDLSDVTWTPKTQNPKPSARYWHAMASIWGTDKMVLFGGGNSTFYNDDTWIYDLKNNTWTDKTPSPRPISYPPSSYGHTIAGVYGMDRVMLFGGRINTSPWHNDETWIYRHFLPTINGTYVSGAYDTCSNSSFKTISWSGITPEYTNISFQLKTANSILNLKNKEFIGPDGTSQTFYTSSPSEIWSGHTGDRWVQYKVYLNISIYTESPTLKDITITYNCLPRTIMIGPVNGSLLSTNKPTFIWTFKDYDSNNQKAFQLLISNDSNFENINYDTGEQTTIEECWEFPTDTSYTELPDGLWYWKIRTQDIDDAWTRYTEPWMIRIDTQAPSSAPMLPNNDEIYNSVYFILGIGNDPDPGSGITKIEIIIKNFKNHYWNGSEWVASKSWLLVEGTTEWFYDSHEVKWESGTKYIIQSRAMDVANNIEVPDTGIIFYIDKDSPISDIDNPANNTWQNNLDTISGTSIDVGGAGINKIELSIKCIEDHIPWDEGAKENYYWSGSQWITSESWLPVTGTTQWYFNSSDITWTTGDTYLICSRAIDKTNNREIPKKGNIFMFDNKLPEISILINNGAKYSTSPGLKLSLQAEDKDSGVSQMSFSTDGTLWMDWEPFNATRLFQINEGDGNKYIYFKVRDNAGNIAVPVFDSIILDTMPPDDLSIIINDGAEFTISTSVKLDLSGKDFGSGIKDMAFSHDGDFWLPWELFNISKKIPIFAGDGIKRIYFRLRDNAGNIAEPIFDSIILDSKPPYSLSISINNNATEINSTHVTLKLNALDNTSGVNLMSLSIDGMNWSAWEDFMDIKSYILPSGDGIKTIYFRVMDHAGNIAEPVMGSILFNTTSPEPGVQAPDKAKPSFNLFKSFTLLLIIFIIIIIIILAVLKIKRKKRSKRELPTNEVDTVKPITTPTLDKFNGNTTTKFTLTQPAKDTAIPTPKLASPETGDQVPVPQQIPQPSLAPQLPPAQTTEFKVEEKTSVPTLATASSKSSAKIQTTQRIEKETGETE